MPHTSSQTFLRELDKKLWTAADKLAAGTGILKERGRLAHSYKITSTGKLIDDALEAVEKENPKFRNVLNKNYTQLQIDPANLAGLIDLIATIPFQHVDLHAKDILGHFYEKGAQASRLFLAEQTAKMAIPLSYFTPKSIVSLIVEMIEPYQGRVYDPAMGSGGFFAGNTRPSGVRFAKRCRASARGVVQSERFIEEHGGTIGDIMVFGQQSNPTTWRLAAMNMAIRGIDFDFGKEPADTFTRDQHPDLRADFVMANPPFNIKEWWDGKLESDARWKYSTPKLMSGDFKFQES